MGLFNRRTTINPLSVEQIKPIVIDALYEFDEGIAKRHEAMNDTELLAGTTFWTVIQAVDNYIVGMFNDKIYSALRNIEQQNSQGDMDLPSRPSFSELYNFQFLKFTMNIRPILSADDKEEILSNINTAKISQTELPAQTAISNFVNEYLVHLQRFELNLAVSQGYGFSDNTEPQLLLNSKVLDIYFQHRPEALKLVQ